MPPICGIVAWLSSTRQRKSSGKKSINVPGVLHIDRAINAFADGPDIGLIVVVSGASQIQRDQIIRLAAQHRLPVVYPYNFFVSAGGLISYGPNVGDMIRQSAAYVDKVLKGAKPGDLPIQQPTRFELLINLKTAKALGLAIPESFLLRADKVIE